MSSYKKFVILVTVFMLVACSGSSNDDPAIATAVALTVAAQNVVPTDTPAAPASPTLFPTQTPLKFSPTLTLLPATLASPTRSGNTAVSECAQASLVSETIPDGTIYRPGEQFTKTWEIQNTSSCTWDTSYKIIFWNGNVLGGGFVYNLPQTTPPGGIVPISLVLIAPAEEATYTSEWMLQTPDGTEFGVGEYSTPFFAEIAVSDDKKPGYTITKVEYQIVREPATGCPANVHWTVYATVTTNGPFEFSYFWVQKDGNDSKPKTAKIDAAGSITFERLWIIGFANTPGEKWVEFHVSDPFTKNYGRAVFLSSCGQQ